MAADYVAAHIGQYDGSRCSHANCWAAVGAYLVDSATRGKKRPTPMQFRRAAGALRDCRAGGIGDLLVGCRRYGVKVRLLSDVTRESMRRRFSSRKSSKVYGVPFDWERWPADKRCGDFQGYHMAAVIPGINKRKSIRTMDPMCDRIRWVRRKDILDAAIEYNDEHCGQKRDTVDMVVVNVPAP